MALLQHSASLSRKGMLSGAVQRNLEAKLWDQLLLTDVQSYSGRVGDDDKPDLSTEGAEVGKGGHLPAISSTRSATG